MPLLMTLPRSFKGAARLLAAMYAQPWMTAVTLGWAHIYYLSFTNLWHSVSYQSCQGSEIGSNHTSSGAQGSGWDHHMPVKIRAV